MTEDQFFRIWIALSGISLLFLFVAALKNKVTVYRDFFDLRCSLILVISPIIALVLIWFISGNETDSSKFATEFLLGQFILLITASIILWAITQTYIMSIRDNGLFVGILVGTAKIIIAAIITIFAIGLLNYLFKDKRKPGHISIFFMLFGLFAWVINVLVNGDRIYANSEEI